MRRLTRDEEKCRSGDEELRAVFMNVAEIFIRRPVMTTLVMLAILLFGIIAYRQLPVSDLPNVDFPTISVSAALPGASCARTSSRVRSACPVRR